MAYYKCCVVNAFMLLNNPRNLLSHFKCYYEMHSEIFDLILIYILLIARSSFV